MEKVVNIQIIQPSLNDWEKVKNLRLEALQNDPQAFGSSYEIESVRTSKEWQEKVQPTLGESPEEILLFAESEGMSVGMLGAYLKDETTWFLKATYVKPEYRGTGVADLLMKKILLLIAQRKEGKKIELFVNAEQPPAVRFYERNGFVVVDTLKDQTLGDGKVYDEYLMRREK